MRRLMLADLSSSVMHSHSSGCSVAACSTTNESAFWMVGSEALTRCSAETKRKRTWNGSISAACLHRNRKGKEVVEVAWKMRSPVSKVERGFRGGILEGSSGGIFGFRACGAFPRHLHVDLTKLIRTLHSACYKAMMELVCVATFKDGSKSGSVYIRQRRIRGVREIRKNKEHQA